MLAIDSIDVLVERVSKSLGNDHLGRESLSMLVAKLQAPVPMRLRCPSCGELHIDEGEFATKPHHTHACQHCGEVWRPAIVHTVGVAFLPGFKNDR